MNQLILGTAQFGLEYGLTHSRVPKTEVRHILRRAWELGIRNLDTATLYGDIEENLLAFMEDMPFTVTSKIPNLPQNLNPDAAQAWLIEAIERTQVLLGSQVTTLLFHRAEDLLESHGQLLWDTAIQLLEHSAIRLGISCYAPETLLSAHNRFPIQVAQMPGNALDQRVKNVHFPQSIDLQLRSLFLQGVLLQPSETIQKAMPWVLAEINQWLDWCKHRGLTPLQACLSLVKGFNRPSHFVIGVDDVAQLENIVSTWNTCSAIEALELATNDLNIIDPRGWNKKR